MVRVCKCSRKPMNEGAFKAYHGDHTKTQFCGECGQKYELELSKVESIRVYFEGGVSGYISIDDLRELLVPDLNDLIADSIDDHTSVWGGPGPDCTTKRREAA